MKRAKQTIQPLALITALFMTMSPLPVAAQTFNEAVAAYERGDFATALRGFQIHAEQGAAAAQFALGLMYSTGEGVPENDAEAARWFRVAAEQGVALAQSWLGSMYANGEGVPESAAEAARWFHLAAKQGVVEAQGNLGVMYAKGEGVPENAVNAYAWFSIAAAQGITRAKEYKESVASGMTRSQIAEAQDLSREYWNLYVLPFQ